MMKKFLVISTKGNFDGVFTSVGDAREATLKVNIACQNTDEFYYTVEQTPYVLIIDDADIAEAMNAFPWVRFNDKTNRGYWYMTKEQYLEQRGSGSYMYVKLPPQSNARKELPSGIVNIEANASYRTRDGRKVDIACVNKASFTDEYCAHGFLSLSDDSHDTTKDAEWTLKGEWKRGWTSDEDIVGPWAQPIKTNDAGMILNLKAEFDHDWVQDYVDKYFEDYKF